MLSGGRFRDVPLGWALEVSSFLVSCLFVVVLRCVSLDARAERWVRTIHDSATGGYSMRMWLPTESKAFLMSQDMKSN